MRNRSTLVNFARKRLGSKELAEDVVQDSLLKALKAARLPNSEEECVKWMYRILRHAIIDVYRRHDTRSRAMEGFLAESEVEPTPEVQRELCQCFRRLLPELPVAYREALRLIDLEGYSPASAAAEMGVTVNNVTVRLHRARKRLRGLMEVTCRTCSRHGCLDCTCQQEG